MGDGLVQVAYLHPHTVSHSWHESMMRLVAYDAAHEGRVLGTAGPHMIRCDSGGIVESRNLAVQTFLDATPHEWLWFIDTDMGFRPDTIDRLVEAADPDERPVVGGLCFSLRELDQDGYGGRRVRPLPTVFGWARNAEGAYGFSVVRGHYPRNTVMQVAATGAACLLIHRTVLEKVRAEYGDTWFDQIRYEDGRRVSEDLSFCYRVNALGSKVFVHTGVKTTHHKEFFLGELDYLRAETPPPATEPVAVLVPVLGRPQNAEPFMASLRASTGLATAYAIVGPEETAEAHEVTVTAWRKAGATVLRTHVCRTFAEKVNAGYARTREPWVFLVGDDVRFHPGWLDQAVAAAGDQFHVIGTNDTANPRVTAGDHATHLLIRRSYIDEQGASWDGPGVVAHEGYRHWYVDDEIVTAAKQRGAWTPALGSVVEHLHPLFGTAEDDATYQLGQSHAEADRATFEKRWTDHAS